MAFCTVVVFKLVFQLARDTKTLTTTWNTRELVMLVDANVGATTRYTVTFANSM